MDGQAEVARLEPLKASLADKAQRVQAIEKLVAGQSAAAAAYTEFYRSIDLFQHEVASFISTLRAQLNVDAAEKKRVDDAVAAVQKRIDDAVAARDAQQQAIAHKESERERLAADVTTAKRWTEFLSSGLQQAVARQRDAIKLLRQHASSATDSAEALFDLQEMEALLGSADSADQADEAASDATDTSLARFLSSWPPERFAAAQQDWYAKLNAAEAAEKAARADAAEAHKRLGELEKTPREAQTKRREWILRELKPTVH